MSPRHSWKLAFVSLLTPTGALLYSGVYKGAWLHVLRRSRKLPSGGFAPRPTGALPMEPTGGFGFGFRLGWAVCIAQILDRSTGPSASPLHSFTHRQTS